MNIRSLKSAIQKSGMPITIDEMPPTECNNQGNIEILLDIETTQLQFAVTNASCCVACYFSDEPNSRKDAIQSLINDIGYGFEPLSKDTAWACGVELKNNA